MRTGPVPAVSRVTVVEITLGGGGFVATVDYIPGWRDLLGAERISLLSDPGAIIHSPVGFPVGAASGVGAAACSEVHLSPFVALRRRPPNDGFVHTVPATQAHSRRAQASSVTNPCFGMRAVRVEKCIIRFIVVRASGLE